MKKKKISKIKIIFISAVIWMLSVAGMSAYSYIINIYREYKIVQQVHQTITTVKEMFQTQDDYDVINTGYYNKEWTIIPDKKTNPKIYKDDCVYSGKNHDNGSPILFCDHLLLGKNFTPDYAITEYRDLFNIYGGDIFMIIGKAACKYTNKTKHTCTFIRFSDLPKNICIKIASQDWQNAGASVKRINEDFDTYFHIRRINYTVNEDISLWKSNILPKEAAKLCNVTNNWIDFIVYK